MPWVSLGKVTSTGGAAARLTVNQSTPASPLPCHAILIQQIVGNTGYIYIGDSSSMNTTTLAHCNGTLAIPTTNSLPSANIVLTDAPNALNAADYYIIASVSGEAALVSILIL